MHTSSLTLMATLLGKVENRLGLLKARPLVVDVGSFDVNGSYRSMVTGRGWEYIGIDQQAGPNVDRVLSVFDLWTGLDSRVDAVISGQMLEHCEDPIRAVEAMRSVLRPGGVIALIAPWMWEIHRYPVDCWRILPDGMEYMLRGLSDIEVGVCERDCWGIATRP